MYIYIRVYIYILTWIEPKKMLSPSFNDSHGLKSVPVRSVLFMDVLGIIHYCVRSVICMSPVPTGCPRVNVKPNPWGRATQRSQI